MPVLRRFTRYVLPVLACASALPSISHAQAANRRSARGPATTGELPRHYTGGPTRAPILAADLMTRLYLFADDSMMGRDRNSDFHNKASNYIASELQRLGLEPAGDNGTWFQSGMVRRGTDATMSTLSVDGTNYTLWTDFAPRNQGTGARTFDGAQVVYGGSLGDTAHMIPSAAAAGKVVLVTLGRDSAGHRDFNVNRQQITFRFLDAAAIAVAQIDYTPAGYVMANYAGTFAVQKTDAAPPAGRSLPNYFYVTNALARALLGADPEAATPGTLGRTVHGGIRFGDLGPAPGRNVIGILRGSDPALRNEYVAIGAHNDHIGYLDGLRFDHDSVRAYHLLVAPQGADDPNRAPTPEEVVRLRAMTDSLHALHGGPRADSIFNGADDDGSGSVSVLEIAEYWANARVKPKRSLLFIWHAGEEGGMLGSGYFTEHTTVPRDSIVAELNVDMIGRGGAADITGVTKEGAQIHGGPGYVQLIGSRRLSTELGDLAETVNRDRHFGLNFDYSLDANGHPQNIYCRSDHWSYAKWGIPIVFFTTGGHADYHQVTDEPQYIDYNRMERVATMISALAERVANLDHRVVVDHPKPDPNGRCQQ
jgi:hypothetical protein